MAHFCGIVQAAIPDDVHREGEEGKRSGVVEVDLNGPEVDTLFATMRRNGAVLDATLRVMVPREWPGVAESDTAGPEVSAGVMIAAGTDGTAPPDSVFPALHEEIRYLREWAGMTIMDVLTAATHHGTVRVRSEVPRFAP